MIENGTSWGPRYENFIFANEEALIFRDTDNDKKVCKWENIKHIYHMDRYNNLAVIDEQGYIAVGRALPDHKFRSSSDKIRYIWEIWRRKIPDAERINTFKYPDLLLAQNAGNTSYVLLGRPVFRWIFILCLLVGIINIGALILAALLLILHLWVTIPIFIEMRRKKEIIISYFQDHLEVMYDD